MSELTATDHIRQKVENEEPTELSKREAKEQLLHEMKRQMGHITFDVDPYDDPDENYGGGVVIANINGRQADHYIYHE